MGRDIWSHAKRSFRTLRTIVQFASLIASSLAELDGKSHPITTAFLSEQVYPLLRQSKEKKRLVQEGEQRETRTPSEYDTESEQRHAARQKKGGKRDA
jgi:hypothetical protein